MVVANTIIRRVSTGIGHIDFRIIAFQFAEILGDVARQNDKVAGMVVCCRSRPIRRERPRQSVGVVAVVVLCNIRPTTGIPRAALGLDHRIRFICMDVCRGFGVEDVLADRVLQLTGDTPRQSHTIRSADELVGHLTGGHIHIGGVLQHTDFRAVVGFETGGTVGVVIVTRTPIRIFVNLNGEGEDQLLALPGAVVVDDRIFSVVEAGHADGIPVDGDSNAVGVSGSLPLVVAGRRGYLHRDILVGSGLGAKAKLTEIEVLRQRVRQGSGFVHVHTACNISADALEDVFQCIRAVSGQIIVAVFRARPKIDETVAVAGGLGIRIIGRHAVHIPVEVAIRVFWICAAEHANRIDRHAILL